VSTRRTATCQSSLQGREWCDYSWSQKLPWGPRPAREQIGHK